MNNGGGQIVGRRRGNALGGGGIQQKLRNTRNAVQAVNPDGGLSRRQRQTLRL